MTDIPDGYEKLPYIGEINPSKLMPVDTLVALVESAPAGSYWYVGGEPNRKSITGADFVDVFHYYYTNIKAIDPGAKITGPSVLNWDFTCIGCGEYQKGEIWLKEFVEAYTDRYGHGPPVDVWTIDTYPIDWTNTPNNDPQKRPLYRGVRVPHWYIATEQLEGLRQYLDSNGYSDTPIWITELAIHVGYEKWKWDPFPTKISPVIPYHWDKMSNYINTLMDWLEVNAERNGIERWFFFTTWQDIVDVRPDGYMGIIFFDGPDQGARLNCLGRLYRQRALGLPRWSCDAIGRTLDESGDVVFDENGNPVPPS